MPSPAIGAEIINNGGGVLHNNFYILGTKRVRGNQRYQNYPDPLGKTIA